MKNMTEIQYGMPRLGQLAGFLRDIVTDDILLIQSNDKNSDSTKKYWDRYCSETSTDNKPVKDYIGYAWMGTEKEIPHLCIKFFESEKEIPEYVSTHIFNFYNSFYKSLRKFNPFPKEMDASKYALVAENSTENYVLFQFCISLFQLMMQLEKDYGLQRAKELILFYLEKLNYKNLLSEILEKSNLRSDILEILNEDKNYFSTIIEHLEKKSKINNEDLYNLINKLSPNSAKNRFLDIKNKDENFTWQEINTICSYVSDKMKCNFKLTHFLKNIEQALKKDLFQTEESINIIKKNLKEYADSDITAKIFYSNLLESFFSPENRGDIYLGGKYGETSGMLNMACSSIFDKHIYKQTGKVPFEQVIDNFKQFAPNSSAFFIPWFKAYISVAKTEYDKAMEYYNKAFQHKYLAGDYLVNFLEQAFCFSNYYKCDWTTTRKAYKNDSGIKNPIQCDPKMFKNFGYAIGAFPHSAENSFKEAYNSFEYFYCFFPTECFLDQEAAASRKKTEFKNRDEIEIETGELEKQDFKDNHPFDVLVSLKDKNKLIPEKSLFTLNKDHNSKQKDLCSPLYLCIKYGFRDDRLLELAKAWIENDEEIDTSATSYNGETPLSIALQEYNRIKYNLDASLELKQKLWYLCKLLCDKCTWENELKFGSKIQTLKFAIDSCDYEIVKKLAEKIPTENFSNYTFGNLTPLVYAIMKKEILSYGVIEYTRKQKDIHIPHIMSDTFGLTRNEKLKNYMYYNPLPQGIDYTKYHMEHWGNDISQEEIDTFISMYGDEDDWKKQEEELEKIIFFFIRRLKNPDCQYIIQSLTLGDNQMNFFLNTPLVISAQCNDIFTSNILINNGANLTPNYDEVGFYNEHFDKTEFFLINNFIYNLIDYKSWETLSWFLEEKSELASKMMKNDNFNMNPLVFFAVKSRDYFIWTSKDKREWNSVIQHIVNLFLKCGADPDEKTILGTARELMDFYKIEIPKK